MQLEEKDLTVMTQTASAKGAMKKAGVFFLLLMLFEIPMAFLVYAVQNIFPAEYSSLISVLMTQGYLLLGAVLYMIITGTKISRDLQVRKYRVSTFFLSLVVLMMASPMASWLNIVSQFFAKNTTSGAILDITNNVPMWLGILIIGCLPGFVEETLYRGIIYTAFRKRSVLTGIVVSALCFGLMHMNFNQVLYAIYLGVIFALLVEATGSLVSTMILHMLFNAMNTAYVYILPKLYEWLGRYYEEYASLDIEAAMNAVPDNSQLVMMTVFLAPFAIGGLVLTILLIKVIANLNGRTLTMASICGNREAVKDTKPVNVFLIIGWIFCLIVCIGNLFGQ